MRFETKRLIIRSPEMSDLEPAITLWTHPEVRKYTGAAPPPEVIKEGFLKDYALRETPFGFRTVIEKESGAYLGDSGLIQKEIDSRPEVEIMYFFHPDHWGKGYATEAAKRLLEFAKDELKLPKIVALIHPENQASAQVAIKLGLRFQKNYTTPSGNLRHLYAIT